MRSIFCAKDHSCVISKVTPCCYKLYGMERKHWNGSSLFQGWPCVPADCGRDRYQLVGQRRQQEHTPPLGSMLRKQGYCHVFDRWVQQDLLYVLSLTA